MVGIEQVAALAGVSTATVSRALRGKEHVSKKAEEAVKAAAKELGYVASASASQLASGKTLNIGVVLPFIDRWFFSVVLEGIETTLIEHGYDLTLYNLSGGPEQRKKVFNEFLMRKRVDGVLTIAVNPSDRELESLNRTGKPIIGIGGAISGARALTIDDVAAGRLATEHLLSLGHKKVGFIGGIPGNDTEFNQPDLRELGYVAALEAAGLQLRDNWIAQANYTIEGAYRAAKQMLGNPRHAPTAIFCSSDEMGFGTIMAAKDLGLRVPQDISVIGLDDHDMSEFFGLSTISQSPRLQGKRAAELLLGLIEAGTTGEVNIEEVTEWPVQLVVRSSTARATPLTR
jgi:DNA-binding LacI/PurR family transcriptional regulator